MKCGEAQKFLSAYQDGRLSSEEAAQMKEHLSACLSCQSEERVLSEIWNTLSVLEPIEPSHNFRARFWQRVREEEELQKSPWERFMHLWNQNVYARPVFALASLILVSLLGTVVALKLIPQDSIYQPKSPIMQWAEGAPRNLRSGGFSL